MAEGWYSRLNEWTKLWVERRKTFFEKHKALYCLAKSARYCFEQAPQILAAIGLFGVLGWAMLKLISTEEWARAAYFILALIAIFSVIRFVYSDRIRKIRGSPKRPMTLFIVAVIGAAIGAPLAILFYFIGNASDRADSMSVAIPSTNSTVSNKSAQPTPLTDTQFGTEERILILMGTESFWYKREDLEKGPQSILKNGDKTYLSVCIKDDQLKLSGDFALNSAATIVQIKDNNITALAAPLDSNHSSDNKKIEIVNDIRTPLLQIFYKTQYCIQIFGLILCDNMVYIADGQRFRPYWPDLTHPDMEPNFLVDIHRLFKYPSSEFLGQANDGTNEYKFPKGSIKIITFRGPSDESVEAAKSIAVFGSLMSIPVYSITNLGSPINGVTAKYKNTSENAQIVFQIVPQVEGLIHYPINCEENTDPADDTITFTVGNFKSGMAVPPQGANPASPKPNQSTSQP